MPRRIPAICQLGKYFVLSHVFIRFNFEITQDRVMKSLPLGESHFFCFPQAVCVPWRITLLQQDEYLRYFDMKSPNYGVLSSEEAKCTFNETIPWTNEWAVCRMHHFFGPSSAGMRKEISCLLLRNLNKLGPLTGYTHLKFTFMDNKQAFISLNSWRETDQLALPG